MKKQFYLLPLIFSFSLIINSSLKAQNKNEELKKIEILNVGSISYPIEIEERSDIPFKLLVDNEYKKLLSDSTDYEQFRPTAIFFEAGFTPNFDQNKKEFAYITVNVLHGKYQLPKTLNKDQENALYNNIKAYIENNLKETHFSIKKWEPLKFNVVSGVPSVGYYYEQVANKKNQTNIITTNLYDSDIQVQIILSAPAKEYKKWLKYYNQMIETFVRKVNIADKFTFEYPITLSDRNDIPFKYMVDNEFKKILGDSIDYEAFRPSMLLLDKSFSIDDSLNIAPFGNITINITPKALNSDPSIILEDFENSVKKSTEENLNPTQYKITRWYPFYQKKISGLPMVSYSYDQEKLGDTIIVNSSIIFDKQFDIQVGMSAPSKDRVKWNEAYKSIIASLNPIIPIGKIGTMLYPNGVEERSDIPFIKLVDEESKRKLGDSINYEIYRPNTLLLEKGFDENNPTQLTSFNSITINTINGDFEKIMDISREDFEKIIKNTEERNLQNTPYKIVAWNSFDIIPLPNDILKVSYSFLQENENSESKNICTTYFYTKDSQSKITLTCNKNDLDKWLVMYSDLIKSFKDKGSR